MLREEEKLVGVREKGLCTSTVDAFSSNFVGGAPVFLSLPTEHAVAAGQSRDKRRSLAEEGWVYIWSDGLNFSSHIGSWHERERKVVA